MRLVGLQGILTIISHLFFIALAFWAISALHIEHLMTFYPRQSRVLIVMLAVAVGFGCSSFFLDFIDNVRNLGYLLR
ncbi:DUF1146 family protein [Levilactobacillus brevis]|uniref:DUF1146 family protein n=1 Tax=Levilactobacillus brevis TaxID=1580 RepID=UPI000BE84C99|nr:DUF1146 family protein [Levilactobacillus brevis]MBT9677097.1 DUF1146 domain-containing protein [Levilactobacillus brevis]MCT3583871.1 DUF1146 domain-containing protein [Levilactobacillus brevis]MCZ2120252.1 DUF1146 family protein [Levilactobacillus brevis]MCZ2125728.1 DUF1146 family protein [Levilactobacillus brevis]MCZ2210060.1 DUF1146 family protein [Levilactobacillus brevis]